MEPVGVRFGNQFGVSDEVSKSGNVEKVQVVPVEGFTKVLSLPNNR